MWPTSLSRGAGIEGQATKTQPLGQRPGGYFHLDAAPSSQVMLQDENDPAEPTRVELHRYDNRLAVASGLRLNPRALQRSRWVQSSEFESSHDIL